MTCINRETLFVFLSIYLHVRIFWVKIFNKLQWKKSHQLHTMRSRAQTKKNKIDHVAKDLVRKNSTNCSYINWLLETFRFLIVSFEKKKRFLGSSKYGCFKWINTWFEAPITSTAEEADTSAIKSNCAYS